VNPAAILENKRLGPILAYIAGQQKKLECPFGQGAAATWPEEPDVQGRIDGHPGVALRDVEASRAALSIQNSTQQRKERLSYPQPSDF
jgi:hypothetical protein